MAPEGYLRGVLADGARPFRHRARVRALLGLPEDDSVPVSFAGAGPRGGFRYVRDSGASTAPAPGPPRVDRLDRAHVAAPDSAPRVTEWQAGGSTWPGTAPPAGLAESAGRQAGAVASGTQQATPTVPVRPAEPVPTATVVVPGQSVRPERPRVMDVSRAHDGQRPESAPTLVPMPSGEPTGSDPLDPGATRREPGADAAVELPFVDRQRPAVRPARTAELTPASGQFADRIEPVNRPAAGPARGSGPAAGAGADVGWVGEAGPDAGRPAHATRMATTSQLPMAGEPRPVDVPIPQMEATSPARPAQRPVAVKRATAWPTVDVAPDAAPPVAVELPYLRPAPRRQTPAPDVPEISAVREVPAPPPAGQVPPREVVVQQPAPAPTGPVAFWERRYLGRRLRARMLR